MQRHPRTTIQNKLHKPCDDDVIDGPSSGQAKGQHEVSPPMIIYEIKMTRLLTLFGLMSIPNSAL